MSDQPAETTAETKSSVYQGLGYPNHRDEDPIEAIGWQGLNTHEIENVSRETIDKESDGSPLD